jgi:hypothetical protein
MPTSAGAAAAKISELKSKLAIYDTIKDVIRANYLPSDGGAAELRVMRADGSSAAPDHFDSVLADLDEKSDELLQELRDWEGMMLESPRKKGGDVRHIAAPPAPDVEPEPEVEPEPKPRKAHGRRFGAVAAKPT